MSWTFLRVDVVLAFHDELIAEHGGSDGVRDSGLLESAIIRPEQRAHDADPDEAELNAAYAYGIAKNHPFVDGNKRVAAVAMETFLALNGYTLSVEDEALVTMIEGLAAGEVEEKALAAWIRENAAPL